MRFLNSHCTGYKYFKDSLVVYMDISSCNLTVGFSNKSNYYYNKKMEKSGLSQSVKNFENV